MKFLNWETTDNPFSEDYRNAVQNIDDALIQLSDEANPEIAIVFLKNAIQILERLK